MLYKGTLNGEAHIITDIQQVEVLLCCQLMSGTIRMNPAMMNDRQISSAAQRVNLWPTQRAKFFLVIIIIIITSVKEVMFLLRLVCVCVCLCVINITQKVTDIFLRKF